MQPFVLGEFRRTLDERFRLTIPSELADALPTGEDHTYTLAKERPGALSLWHADAWNARLERDVALIRSKIQAGRLQDRVNEVQRLGRLLSTRHREINIAGRGRLSIPEGFREFLGAEQGSDIILVGAAVCIEIWSPSAWLHYLNDHIPDFSTLVEDLAK